MSTDGLPGLDFAITGRKAWINIQRVAIYPKMPLFWKLLRKQRTRVHVHESGFGWIWPNQPDSSFCLGEAQMCQNGQRELEMKPQFMCQMPMKLNDFSDAVLKAFIQPPILILSKKSTQATACRVRRKYVAGIVKCWEKRCVKTTMSNKNSDSSSQRRLSQQINR